MRDYLGFVAIVLWVLMPGSAGWALAGEGERESTEEVAFVETSLGNLTIAFWPEVAPRTVENFKKLARSGFYDGTAFHRIIAGFMAQGGDPLTKDPTKEALWGTGGPGWRVPAEFNERKHTRGVISMARSEDPDSAGSQFFLMFAPAPHLDGSYTAFGRVIEGDEVLSALERVPVGPQPGGGMEVSRPLERVEIKRVRIVARERAEGGSNSTN